MSDPTKPPERVYISANEMGLSESIVGLAFRDSTGDDHAYTLTSLYPGTPEQMRKAIELVRHAEALISYHPDPSTARAYLAEARDFIAALKKKEKP